MADIFGRSKKDQGPLLLGKLILVQDANGPLSSRVRLELDEKSTAPGKWAERLTLTIAADSPLVHGQLVSIITNPDPAAPPEQFPVDLELPLAANQFRDCDGFTRQVDRITITDILAVSEDDFRKRWKARTTAASSSAASEPQANRPNHQCQPDSLSCGE